MQVILVAFTAVLSLMVVVQIMGSTKGVDRATLQLQRALEAKGRVLVQNNAQALSRMVSDNAFIAVQELVEKTVQNDEDVIYGVYMDVSRKAWINAREFERHSVLEDFPEVLNDSMSYWAATIKDFDKKEINDGNGLRAIEFCAAVNVEGQIKGFIRYGVSTVELLAGIDHARKNNMKALILSLVVVVLLAIMALLTSFYVIRKQSIRIFAPIIDLEEKAKEIAEGNYDQVIQIDSDDEIGELAESFDHMRQKIKRYTDHLEQLIQEKMRQVRDILDNIDQGLFSVNFDGSINGEYSRKTKDIVGFDQLEKFNVLQVLRLGEEDAEAWSDWIDLVRSRHRQMQWNKLLRLAPIRERIVRNENGESRILNFSFQKILGKSGDLERLMVLVHDVTETRRVENIVLQEKQKHENEVRTILGLVKNLPEVIQEFLSDLDLRMDQIEVELKRMKQDADFARSNFPNGPVHVIAPETVADIYRNLHTIKGNASSYGFDSLSFIADRAEENLELLRPPIRERTQDTLEQLLKDIQEMRLERANIDQTSRMLRGGSENFSVCISEKKVAYIQKIAETLYRETNLLEKDMFEPLLDACLKIRYVPLTKLAEKYAKMVNRIASKLGKKVELAVSPVELEVEPTFFSPFNEALVHILRNAIDHGIETSEERLQMGKPSTGLIEMMIHMSDDQCSLEIQDDGKGIDPERLAKVAVHKGLLTEDIVQKLTIQQKLEIIFLPRFSTKEIASDISGRGVGMDAVANSIEKKGGRVKVFSEYGKNTRIRIELPNTHHHRMIDFGSAE